MAECDRYVVIEEWCPPSSTSGLIAFAFLAFLAALAGPAAPPRFDDDMARHAVRALRAEAAGLQDRRELWRSLGLVLS